MSTVEFHPWNSRRADTEKPDEWRIDLDPGDACDYATVRRVAHVAHEVLDELGATGFPKTSGGSGMHVYVRIRARARLQGRTTGGAGVRARGRAAHRRRDDDLVAQGPRPHQAVRGLQPERPRPHDRGGLLGARQPRGDGLHPDPVGRGRRRGAAGLHDRHGAGPLRRARRPARRASTTRSSTSRRCSSGPTRDERDGAETPEPCPRTSPYDRQAVPGEVVAQRRQAVVDVPLLGAQADRSGRRSTLARVVVDEAAPVRGRRRAGPGSAVKYAGSGLATPSS